MQCPNCGNAIEADFGVVTCGHCQAVFSVDLDGQVESSQSGPSFSQEAIIEVEASPAPSSEIEMEEVIEQQIVEDPFVVEPSFAQGSQEIEQVEIAPANLESVSDFANTDVSVTGPLTYNVVIEGLDNKQLYQDVHQVLSEPRLMLDAHSLMKMVRMGRLELRGLNPIKTSRIVSRLSELPLKISWKQAVYDH